MLFTSIPQFSCRIHARVHFCRCQSASSREHTIPIQRRKIGSVVAAAVADILPGSITPDFDRWLFKTWFEKRVSKINNPIIAIIVMPYWWDGYLNDYVHNFSVTLYDHKDPIGTYARSAKIYDRLSDVFAELISTVTGIITHTEANYRNMLVLRKLSEVCVIRNAGYGYQSERPRRSG